MSIKNNLCIVKKMVEDILFKRNRNSTFKNNIKDYIKNYVNNLGTTTIIPENDYNIELQQEKFISKFKLLGLKITIVTGQDWNVEISVIDNGILNGKAPYTYLWEYDVVYFSHVGDLTSPVLKLSCGYNINDITAQVLLQLKDSRNFQVSRTAWINYGVIENQPDFEPVANIKDFQVIPDFDNDTLEFTWDNSFLNIGFTGQTIVYNKVGEVIPLALTLPLAINVNSYTLPTPMLDLFLPNNIYWFRIEANYGVNQKTLNENGIQYLPYTNNVPIVVPDFDLTPVVSDITHKSAKVTFPITIYNSNANTLRIKVEEMFGDHNIVFERTYTIGSEDLVATLINLSSGNTQGKEYRVYYFVEFNINGVIFSNENYSLDLWVEFDTVTISIASYNLILNSGLNPDLFIEASWLNDNPESLFDVYYKKATDAEYTLSTNGEGVTSPFTVASGAELLANTTYNVKIVTVGTGSPSVIGIIKTPVINVAPIISHVSITETSATIQEKPVITSVELINSYI